MSWESILKYKSKYWHKHVDDIMADGIQRSAASIVSALYDIVTTRNNQGAVRTGKNIPGAGAVAYYMKINKEYVNVGNYEWVRREL